MPPSLEKFAAGSLATAAALEIISHAVSKPAGNLGGYAVAQKIIGGGPDTSRKIAACGGPVVVGTAVSLLGGLLFAIFSGRSITR